MKVDEAIEKSDVGMAERINPRNSYLIARRYQDSIGGIRIVASYTDPTVVRKLRWNELNSDDWFPLKESAE
jgi:hypothetical protein